MAEMMNLRAHSAEEKIQTNRAEQGEAVSSVSFKFDAINRVLIT
jgi:hypothetical protein